LHRVKTTKYTKFDDFLETYKNKTSSLNKHKKALELFIIIHPNINPETYFRDTRLLSKQKEILIKDRIEKDMKTYQRELEKNYSPNTVESYISSIRTFLIFCHITLDESFWKTLNNLKIAIGNSHFDTSPTKQQIKIILSNAKALDKALFLTMVSTGLREQDIIDIEMNDLHLNEKPPRIVIKTLSNNKKRRLPFTFITEECKEAIELWIIQKEEYIKKTRKISNLPIKWETSNKLFPISEVTARNRWNKLLKDSNLNEQSTNQNGRKQFIFHLYTLKKFFRSYLDNRDLAEYLIGHTNISNLYYNKNIEEIKQEYLKYSKNLYILNNPKIPENISIELEQRDKEIQKLTDANKYLEKVVSKIKDEFKDLKEEMNSTIKTLIPEPKPGLPTYHLGFKYKNGRRIDYKWDDKQMKEIQVSKSEQNQINISDSNDELQEYVSTYEKIQKEHPGLTDYDYHHMTCIEIDKNKKNKNK